MLHSGPPFHYAGDASKLCRPHGPQDAQHIQVGVRLVKIAASRGPIQSDRLEILPRRIVQPFHQILQRLMYIAHRVLRLPASRCPTASAAASAKPAKSSAAGIATRAPAKSAASSPTARHPANHWSNPPAATAASSATSGSSNGENNPNNEEYCPKTNRRRTSRLSSLPCNWRPARQSHTAIIRNIFRQHPSRRLNRGAVISLAQQRHHRAPRVAGTRIVDHRFKPVAHFNSIFMFLGGHKQQNPAIIALASHSEL